MSNDVKPYTREEFATVEARIREIGTDAMDLDWMRRGPERQEEPWWFKRLLATARAGLADTEMMELLSDPEFWDRIGFDSDTLRWEVYHGHTIRTPDGLAAELTQHDDLRAAIDKGMQRTLGERVDSSTDGGR